jgi:CBS-domain-containing membrane protein
MRRSFAVGKRSGACINFKHDLTRVGLLRASRTAYPIEELPQGPTQEPRFVDVAHSRSHVSTRQNHKKREMGVRSMKQQTVTVADILKFKGSGVDTIRPNETVETLSRRLKQRQIGAMAVSDDGETLFGIVSERDVAYGVATH